MRTARWQIWVDTGGTFTDAVGRAPDGRIHVVKVLSTSALTARVAAVLGKDRLRLAPQPPLPAGVCRGLQLGGRESHPIRVAAHPTFDELVLANTIDLPPETRIVLQAPFPAPILAAHMLTTTPADAPLPPIDLRLATTRGTNALLEQRGTPPTLFVTRGFRDLLAIGDQTRPDLFARAIRKPPTLVREVIEIDERLAADGTVCTNITPPAQATAAPAPAWSVVSLLHADRYPEHEQRAVQALKHAGNNPRVCGAADLTATIGYLQRSRTAVVNAYLQPCVGGYLDAVAEALPGGTLTIMDSAGGLHEAQDFQPKDSLLSGPAGGAHGATNAARYAGFEHVLLLDMGGTSSDLSRADGRVALQHRHQVGPVSLSAPALAIETIAAGGGSVLHITGDRLRVGPHSAGADPGPACYGHGGPLTLTDANVLLGRIAPAEFGIPADIHAAHTAAEAMHRKAQRIPELATLSLEGLLDAFVMLADEQLAEAVRTVAHRDGFDPRAYALVGFGGAGGQHAAAVAERLDIDTVITPPGVGTLSAYGLGIAPHSAWAQAQCLAPLEQVAPMLSSRFAALARQARDRLPRGIRRRAHVARRELALRLQGQSSTVTLAYDPNDDTRRLRHRFWDCYAARYGYTPSPYQTIEVTVLRVEATIPAPDLPPPTANNATTRSSGDASHTQTLWWRQETLQANIFRRAQLPPGATISAPAIVAEAHATTVVPPGWQANVDNSGSLILRRRHTATAATTREPRALRRERLIRRLTGIAEGMGEMLRRTAVSINVKERADFSCAVLDHRGRLLVHAPHIPVHLGALGLCVRSVCREGPPPPGTTLITNHPAHGGSHLPDITLITPVWVAERHVGYVANRAHHAELGGRIPGSMPPNATNLAEEGVVLPPQRLVADGRAAWAEIERQLRAAPYPSRAVAENLADLRAQLAANHNGADAVARLIERDGDTAFQDAADALYAFAAQRTRSCFRSLGPMKRTRRTKLDDGTPLAVDATIADNKLKLDFRGTGGPHPHNLNATPAIVQSVVMYVLRLLPDDKHVPLNEGLLAPVRLQLGENLCAPRFAAEPARCPAVVGGNTEISQQLANLLVDLFELGAAGQGTMNNLVFGNQDFGVYETLAGGAGAVEHAPGADAVHTHMTNTRISDPEVLEFRYPVRLETFAIRANSGGAGQYQGGDGILRRLRSLAPMRIAVLTQHRTHGPPGAAGARAGSPGAQWIERRNGYRDVLAGCAETHLAPGDVFCIATPGGGGWGPPHDP